MIDDNRHICFTQVLDHPTQNLAIEYVRDAEWDRHWAVVFNGASGCRQEVRRLCSYTEAKAVVERHLQRRQSWDIKMGEDRMTDKPWSFVDFDLVAESRWVIYDDNLGQIVATFHNGPEAQKYLDWRNRKQAKKRKKRQQALAARMGSPVWDDDGRC